MATANKTKTAAITTIAKPKAKRYVYYNVYQPKLEYWKARGYKEGCTKEEYIKHFPRELRRSPIPFTLMKKEVA